MKDKVNKKVIIIIAAVIVILAAAVILLPKKTGGKASVVRIATASGDTVKLSGITVLAQQYGYLEEEFKASGYDIEFLPFANGVAANEALITGDVDMAIIGDVPASTLVSNDIPVTWIAVSVRQNAAIVVSPDSGIEDIYGLEGKTVSYNIGTSPQFLWESAVNYFQLDRSTVEEVNLTNSDSIAALNSGNIDAAVMGEGDALLLQNEGVAKVILTTADYPQWASQNPVVARTAFLEENPDAAAAYHRAAIRALERVREDVKTDSETIYSLLGSGKYDEYPDIAEQIYNKDDGEFNYLISEVNDDDIERLQAIEEFFYSVDLLTNVNQVSDYVEQSYYDEAVRQLEE